MEKDKLEGNPIAIANARFTSIVTIAIDQIANTYKELLAELGEKEFNKLLLEAGNNTDSLFVGAIMKGLDELRWIKEQQKK